MQPEKTTARPPLELPPDLEGSSARDHALAELRKKKAQDKRAKRRKRGKGFSTGKTPEEIEHEQALARVQLAANGISGLHGEPELAVLLNVIVRDAPDIAVAITRMLNQLLRSRITQEAQNHALVAAVKADPTGRRIAEATKATNRKRSNGGIILP
jgi:hypothetical protein